MAFVVREDALKRLLDALRRIQSSTSSSFWICARGHREWVAEVFFCTLGEDFLIIQQLRDNQCYGETCRDSDAVIRQLRISLEGDVTSAEIHTKGCTPGWMQRHFGSE